MNGRAWVAPRERRAARGCSAARRRQRLGSGPGRTHTARADAVPPCYSGLCPPLALVSPGHRLHRCSAANRSQGRRSSCPPPTSPLPARSPPSSAQRSVCRHSRAQLQQPPHPCPRPACPLHLLPLTVPRTPSAASASRKRTARLVERSSQAPRAPQCPRPPRPSSRPASPTIPTPSRSARRARPQNGPRRRPRARRRRQRNRAGMRRHRRPRPPRLLPRRQPRSSSADAPRRRLHSLLPLLLSQLRSRCLNCYLLTRMILTRPS